MNTQVINNADALNAITVNQLFVDGFNMAIKQATGYSLKQWPKGGGERPTDAMLTAAVLFSKQRKCGAESLFLALQMRPQGASLSELACIIDAGPAHNHTRDTERAGYIVRSKGGGRFMVTFTAKGAKALAALATQPATVEATKAADKPKVKKATGVAKRGKATSEAPKRKRKGKAPSTELNADTMKAVEAELHERNEQLQRDASPDQPTNDGGGTANQQQQPTT